MGPPSNPHSALRTPHSPDVSFIIPLYNCLPLTRQMVASLQATLPSSLGHEIILVDDGSTDGTREWLATLTAPPFRVLLNERNLGFAGANNRAAALARGQSLFLLNNDLILLPGWLEPMLSAHAALGPRAGIVGNIQRDARNGQVDHAGIFINLKAKPEHLRQVPTSGAPARSGLLPVDAVTAACVMIERSLWNQLGGFDEGYVNGCEDVDLCFRARAAGRTNAVALRSVVRHHISASPGRKARDEQNTRRLTLRWRAELAAAGARLWSRRYYGLGTLETPPSDSPFDFQVWLHATGLRATPPPRSLAAMNAAIDRELARWDQMFGPNGPTSSPGS